MWVLFASKSDVIGQGYENFRSPLGDSNRQAQLRTARLNLVLTLHPPKQGSLSQWNQMDFRV